MGLDAFVRCNCFELRKIAEPPLPYEDLYVDGDGNIFSKMLSREYERLSYRQYCARYGDLTDALRDWQEDCCEHKYMEYYADWIGNIAGIAQYRGIINSVGPDTLPVLSCMLPRGNGGSFPVELAQKALDELDILDEKIKKINEVVLKNITTGEDEWTLAEDDCFTLMYSPRGYKVGLDKEGLFVVQDDCGIVFRSKHFIQVPTGIIENNTHEITLINLDKNSKTQGQEFVVFGSLDPNSNKTAEFQVEVRPFEQELWESEKIRKLLKASLEMGNPIQWC